ncbi:MAG: hypothetical protein DRJ69_05740, partial [Thermoprotei archaeon]
IADFLINSFLGGEAGVYSYLIELPLAVNSTGTGPVESIGPAVLNLHTLMTNLAFILFSIVLVVAGLCYALESFKVMSEGTAANIVMSGFFTLIMIFLIIPFYNTVAGMVNMLTDPASGFILEDGMLTAVVNAAVEPIPFWETGSHLADAVIKFLMSIFFLIMTMGTIIIACILGTLRIFLTGACVAIMPLLLVLRLIPFTRRAAEAFIEVLIGLIIGSLMAAIFIRFGYEVVQVWTGIPATIVAIATLIAAAMMPTVMAPRLGTLFLVSAGMTSQAVSTAVSGLVTAGVGAAVGAGTGVAGGLTGGLGLKGTARAALMGFQRGAARGLLPAMVGGGPTMRMGRYFHFPALGKAGIEGVSAGLGAVEKPLIEESKLKGELLNSHLFEEKPRTVGGLMDLLRARRAASTVEALMAKYIASPPSKVTVEEGMKHQAKLMNMNGEEAYSYILGSGNILDDKLKGRAREFGAALKQTLLNASPLAAAAVISGFRKFNTLNAKEQRAVMKDAVKGFRLNIEKARGRAVEVPDIAETAADDLLVHWAASDLLSGTTVEHGLMEQEKIARMKPEEAVDYIWKGTAVAEEIPYAKRRTVGEMVKNVVLNAPPLVASNIIARAASFRTLPKEWQLGLMKEATALRGENQARLNDIISGRIKPDLGRMDDSPHFAIDMFNPGVLSEKGRLINAKLIEGARKNWNPNADVDAGKKLLEGWKSLRDEGPEVLAKHVADLVRVEDLTDEEARKFGLGFWQLFKNADKHDGKLLLLANIAEKTTGKKAEAWNRLMDNAQFRSRAVENVENFETQAWLANTLFGGQDERYVEGIDSLFKAEAKPARIPEVEGPMSTRILEHLKTGPKTWSQLMELGPKSTVGSAIKRLVRSGRVVRVKRGLYSLPAQSPAGRLLEYVADGPKPRSQLINSLMRDFGISKAAASSLIRRSVEEYKLAKTGKGMYGLPPSREGMEVVRSKTPDGGVLTYVKPPSWAEIKPPTETQSRILEALKDQPKSAKQLTAELGLKESRVEADLRSLY